MQSLDISFCSDGAKCKQKKNCWRWIGVDFQEKQGMYWWAEFYQKAKESGRACEDFMEAKTNS
jgi:hypothetical protein